MSRRPVGVRRSRRRPRTYVACVFVADERAMGHVHTFWSTPEMVKATEATLIYPGITAHSIEKILKTCMGKEKRANEIILQGCW